MNTVASLPASLLPCPFCGETPNIGTWKHAVARHPGATAIECSGDLFDCPVNPTATGYTQEEAIAAWNRRALASPAVEDGLPEGHPQAPMPAGWLTLAVPGGTESGRDFVHGPRRAIEVCQRALLATAEQPGSAVQGEAREPDGYHYVYIWPFSNKHQEVIVKDGNGGEWNGQKPLRSVPYYYTTPPPEQGDALALLREIRATGVGLNEHWLARVDAVLANAAQPQARGVEEQRCSEPCGDAMTTGDCPCTAASDEGEQVAASEDGLPELPHPDHAQVATFEGTPYVLISPEDYEAIYRRLAALSGVSAPREEPEGIAKLRLAVQGEAVADYVPGELDRTAPARVWLQIDTSASNDERDDPWPGAEHVTWQDESIGGLEIQYVRADLATTTPPAPAAEPRCDCGANPENRWPHHDECALNQNAPAAEQGDTCPKCGATSEDDAGSKCIPDGDSCPGVESPLAEAWAQPEARGVEEWERLSMLSLAEGLRKRGDDLSVDSASWLEKIATPNPVRAEQPEGEGEWPKNLFVLGAPIHAVYVPPGYAIDGVAMRDERVLRFVAAAPAAPVGVDEVWPVIDRLLGQAYGAGLNDEAFDMLAAKAKVTAALAGKAQEESND